MQLTLKQITKLMQRVWPVCLFLKAGEPTGTKKKTFDSAYIEKRFCCDTDVLILREEDLRHWRWANEQRIKKVIADVHRPAVLRSLC